MSGPTCQQNKRHVIPRPPLIRSARHLDPLAHLPLPAQCPSRDLRPYSMYFRPESMLPVQVELDAGLNE
jgi:hypothetical protein